MPTQLSPRSSLVLDGVRGFAAIAVAVSHLRWLFLVDYRELKTSNLLTKLLYFVSGFGHQAVMVFFVLSGYFIASRVKRSFYKGEWSWVSYFGARWSRLATVLWPALVLCVFWDRLGLHLFGLHGVYEGDPAFGGTIMPASPGLLERSGALAFLGNAFFLQRALVPPYGTNAALWSISYEFWYYMLFPLALELVQARRTAAQRLIRVVVLAAIMYLVGFEIMLYWAVWLLGAAIAYAPRLDGLRGSRNLGLAQGATVLLFLGSLVLTRGGFVGPGPDFILGLTFAAWLYVGVHIEGSPTSTFWRRTMQKSSAVSYSLYALHMPPLIFLRAALGRAPRWQPTLASLALAATIFIGALVYTQLCWTLFESRTPSVRSRVEELLSRVFRSAGTGLIKRA